MYHAVQYSHLRILRVHTAFISYLHVCQRRGGTLTIFMESVFVPEKGWNSDYIHGVCVCAREGVELWLYSWSLCLCQRRGELWLYSWSLCLCQRRGGTLAIFMESVFVPEKGWNSGYIHGSLCLCQRRGGTLAIFMALCLCHRSDYNLALFPALRQTYMYYRNNLNSGRYSYCYISLEVFMPYWNLEQTRDIILNHCKRLEVGQGLGLDQAELHLRCPSCVKLISGFLGIFPRNICKCT